jgi:hypothetical protein
MNIDLEHLPIHEIIGEVDEANKRNIFICPDCDYEAVIYWGGDKREVINGGDVNVHHIGSVGAIRMSKSTMYRDGDGNDPHLDVFEDYMDIRWHDRLWVHIKHPELTRSLIVLWRMRLALWFVDLGIMIGDWIHPYKGTDE